MGADPEVRARADRLRETRRRLALVATICEGLNLGESVWRAALAEAKAQFPGTEFAGTAAEALRDHLAGGDRE